MDETDLESSLRALDERLSLGEYELEAYLAILEHGELTAGAIAEETEIPQPRVYDTVRSLRDRGLIDLVETRPMTAIAIDPEAAFGDLDDALERTLTALEERYVAPTREREAVSLVRSRTSILRRFEEVIEGARVELTMALTPDLLDRFEPMLTAARDDELSVDLLLAPDAESPDPETFDYATVATAARTRRGITTPVLAVADGRHSVYATQDALRDDSDRYAVVFDRSALGFLVGGFFETVLWTTTARELIDERDRRSFPRRYASIRRCVKSIVAEDRTVFATVAGRDVVTGRPKRASGRVVDVTFEPTEAVASLTLETEDGRVAVGGRVAAYEDLEAHEIAVGLSAPPTLENDGSW